MPQSPRHRGGFTLVELLVVVALLGIFLVGLGQVFGPHAADNQASRRGAYEDVAGAVDGALRDAMSGWGGLAQDKGVRDDAGLLPERYGVVFLRDPDVRNADSSGYWAVQTQDRTGAGSAWRRVILAERREYASPFLRLAKITAKADDSDPGADLPGLAVLFKNPTGVETFDADARRYSAPGSPALPADAGNTVAEFPAPAPEKRWKRYDLEFRDDRDKAAFTVTVRDDKTVFVTLP